MFFPCFARISKCRVLPDHQPRTTQEQSSLLRTWKENNIKQFNVLLHQAATQSRGNTQSFFDFMNARDKDSFNIMHLTALTADLESLSALFDALERYYGSNKQAISKYLMTTDKRGLTVLSLAEYNGDKRVMEIVLMRAMQLIGSDKKLFFDFLNKGDKESDWKPLANASFDNEYPLVEMMIKIAAYVFGRDSDYFKKFINALDDEGNNALFYANSNRIKLLLLNYGARRLAEKKQAKLRIENANKWGMKLNEASNRDKFGLFKKTLDEVEAKYKDDQDFLFYFFSTADDAGWTPFINTAADNQYKYIKLLLERIDKLLPEEDKDDKSLFLSNADFEGRMPLHLAILRRNFKVAKLIIDNLVRYSINKPFLYTALNGANNLNGFTPFINAVYASEIYDEEVFEFIKYFLEKMAELFGRNARIFYLFLNSRDYNGFSALAYATDEKIIKLLKSYGAVDTMEKKIKGVGEYSTLMMMEEGEI